MSQRLLMKQHRQAFHRNLDFEMEGRLALASARREGKRKIAENRLHLDVAEQEAAQVAIAFLGVDHSITSAVRPVDESQMRAPNPPAVDLDQSIALRSDGPAGCAVRRLII